jgi:hypothetical protein
MLSARFPARKLGIIKQTHYLSSLYLDCENCKTKHRGLQSNAPYIESATFQFES